MSRAKNSEIHWARNSKTDSRPIIKIGIWSIGVVMVLFLIWGSFFQLSSAVITPGTLVSQGRNKLIQHSVGGRVLRIYVTEGERLKAGQIVLELDPTQAQAELSKINSRHASLTALKSRLDAERQGGAGVMTRRVKKMQLRGANDVFSTAGISTNKLGLRGSDGADSGASFKVTKVSAIRDELYESQQEAYLSGRALLTKEVDGLNQKIGTLKRQKAGLEARISAQRELLNLTYNEVQRLRPLVAKGYVARNRVEKQERTLLELRGNVAAMQLDSQSYDNQISEVLTQVEKARIKNSDVASREYARIVAELAEVKDLRGAAHAAVATLVVRSPESGTLTKLSITTTGGVFGGGDVIGEIVPDEAPVLVEARVSPSDIDFVNIGQSADVAITAFNRRLHDTMDGEVVYVSADSQKDDKTGEQYFITRLKFSPDSEKNAEMLDKLQAGMQGEVYIHTGSRTFLTYLSKPLVDSFKRAFRER